MILSPQGNCYYYFHIQTFIYLSLHLYYCFCQKHFSCLLFLAITNAVFKIGAEDRILPETLPESQGGGSAPS